MLAVVNDGYDDAEFEIIGNVAMDAAKGTLQADFNYIAVSFGSGGDTYELHASYSVAPIDEVELQNGEPTMLLDMSEAELDSFAEEIQINAEYLLYEIMGIFS